MDGSPLLLPPTKPPDGKEEGEGAVRRLASWRQWLGLTTATVLINGTSTAKNESLL